MLIPIRLLVPTAALFAALIVLAWSAGEARADDPPPYFPFGPQINVPEGDLEGWTLCYSSNYDEGGDAIADILAACDREYLLLGGKPVASDTFDVLAAGQRSDVLTDTGAHETSTHEANGTGWYFNGSYSWGFAPAGLPVLKQECDVYDRDDAPGHGGVTDGEYRLCWHTFSDDISSGFRSGLAAFLQAGVTTHERFIYHAGAPVVGEDITPPEANVRFERKQGNGWVPYSPGNWSRTIVRAILTCDDDGSGMMDLEKTQQHIFKQSMDEDVDIASLFNPCEDRAGNVNDLASLGTDDIMVDLVNPVCFADPPSLRIAPTGEHEDVFLQLTVSDNFPGADIVDAEGASSDGGGDPGGVFPISSTPGPNSIVYDVQATPLATKSGLQRTYTYTFFARDDAGRTSTCMFIVKVK